MTVHEMDSFDTQFYPGSDVQITAIGGICIWQDGVTSP